MEPSVFQRVNVTYVFRFILSSHHMNEISLSYAKQGVFGFMERHIYVLNLTLYSHVLNKNETTDAYNKL